MDHSLLSLIRQVARGKPPASTTSRTQDGRIDLRGADVSSVGTERWFGSGLPKGTRNREFKPFRFQESTVEPCNDRVFLGGLALHDIDFSGARLVNIWFYDCTIRNCVFDGASCENWGMWGTTVTDASFDSASLKGSMLGGVRDGKRTSFENVCFARSDMRSITCGAAIFSDCLFDHANLLRVDFGGSIFRQCTFRGPMREVIFYDRPFRGEQLEPNTMEDVDFSEASLHHVEFRRLNLDQIALPSEKSHLIVRRYPTALDRALTHLHSDDLRHRKMRATLELRKKWLGPSQDVGIFNRTDMLESFGQEGATELEMLLLEGSDYGE